VQAPGEGFTVNLPLKSQCSTYSQPARIFLMMESGIQGGTHDSESQLLRVFVINTSGLMERTVLDSYIFLE